MTFSLFSRETLLGFAMVSRAAALIATTCAFSWGPRVFAEPPPVKLPPGEDHPVRVFEKRIMPIYESPQSSSCSRCHLAGVDLKDYILPDARKTFLSLRDQGLIDTEKPGESRIIRLIERAGNANKAGASDAKSRAEKEAFLAWIQACVNHRDWIEAPKPLEKNLKRPALPGEVVRHARKDRILESFESNIWAWRFRCMNCHTEGTPQNNKLVAKHGARVSWVKKAGPEATLESLLGSGLIDYQHPEKSLLLSKPLGQDHEGGVKFVVGDQAYQGFRSWIEDLVSIRNQQYRKVEDLPKAAAPLEAFGTDIWFRLASLPGEWEGKLLQVRIHRWDQETNDWANQPIATSDRPVSGKPASWQHNLTLLAPKGSAAAKGFRAKEPSLPPGKYLVRLYLDSKGIAGKNWRSLLTESDQVGQFEFQAVWRAGYGAMTKVDYPATR